MVKTNYPTGRVMRKDFRGAKLSLRILPMAHWAHGSTNMARLAICTSLLEARGCAVSAVVAYLFDFMVQDCLEAILDMMYLYLNINNIQ